MTLAFASAGVASAQSKFQCAAGRNLRDERHGVGASLLGAGLSGLQAGGRGHGLRDRVLGHAGLRHHQADRLVRTGPRQEARRRPAASDAVRPVHRADQPGDRQRHPGGDLRGGFAEVEAHRLHHLGQSRGGEVRRRGDRQAGRRQRRIRRAGESRAEQPRPARHRA